MGERENALVHTRSPIMTYDVPFRHLQALDPSGLTTIAATLHALTKGMEDCRVAGVDPEYDPAIALIARHFATVSANCADEDSLRSSCSRRIVELERFPALLSLAMRGVAHDRAAKERFHQDARKAMRNLARALGLAEGSYTVTSAYGDPAIAGNVLFSSDTIEMSLSIGPLHEGNELQYYAKRGPAARERLRFAAMRDFLKPARFAARLRRELRLDQIVPAEQPQAERLPVAA